MNEEETKQAEEKAAEKKKDPPFYKRIHPVILIGGGFVVFLLIRSMMMDQENKSSYLIWIGVAAALFYLLRESAVGPSESMVRPWEAEKLAEMECARKLKWGQWPVGTKFKIGPVCRLQHRSGGGIYYEVGVEALIPFDRPETWVAIVMAKGPEKAFTFLTKTIAPLTGRETVNEKSWFPEWFKAARKDDLMEKLIFK